MYRNYSKPTKEMIKNWKAAREWYKERFSLLNGIGFNKKLFFRAGLDRRNPRDWGPAWMFCWSKPGVKVKIEKDGCVVFTWPTSKGFTTSCWQPRKDEELVRKKSRGNPRSTVPPGYINLSKLYDRWPPDLINEFAKIPDMTRPNPINAKWCPMKLYSLKRIEETEASPEFKERFRSSIWVTQRHS